MRPCAPRPSVHAMNDRVLRIGAVAALTGAVAQFVASALEPDWGGSPAKAIRVVADNASWNGDRVLDLIGVFLTIAALTIGSSLLAEGPGREWARAGRPFLVLMGALGASAVATGHGMKEVADSWASAAPQARQSYLAAFDVARPITDALFFGAFLALGLCLATLGVGILAGRAYACWTGWVSVLSAALLISGDLLNIIFDAAFVAVLAGFVLFTVVLIALGVSMWRHASRLSSTRSAGARKARRMRPYLNPKEG
jgi:hypothetical protein